MIVKFRQSESRRKKNWDNAPDFYSSNSEELNLRALFDGPEGVETLPAPPTSTPEPQPNPPTPRWGAIGAMIAFVAMGVCVGVCVPV